MENQKKIFFVAGDEERDVLMKKSVSLGYSLMLLILVIRNCENMETLEKFSSRLINISDQGKITITVYYLFGMISLHKSEF